jgi:hypothetical protein
MKTLLLDRTAWDLVLDTSGNIALASNPYAIAQDVASAVKLFAGECWFDTTKGIPYFDQVLGHLPPQSVVKAYVENAALTVPEVAEAQCTLVSLKGRVLAGQIDVIDTAGVSHNVTF